MIVGKFIISMLLKKGIIAPAVSSYKADTIALFANLPLIAL